MHVAICDCDRSFCTRLAKIIRHGAAAVNARITIHVFCSSDDLLEAVENLDYMAVFLDIELGMKNGFQVGKTIKRWRKSTEIVFVTSNEGYILSGYSIPAYRYILKRSLESDVLECVTSLLLERYRAQSLIHLGFFGASGDLRSDTVEYVESNAPFSIFHRASPKDGPVVQIEANLDNIEKLLIYYRFIRLQKRYLVNCRYVVSISHYNVILASGISIPVQRKNYMSTKTNLESFRRQIHLLS